MKLKFIGSLVVALSSFPAMCSALSFAPGTEFLPLNCIDSAEPVAYAGSGRVGVFNEKVAIGADYSFEPVFEGTEIINWGAGQSVTYTLDFSEDIESGWLTGLDFTQGSSDAGGDLSWFDIEIFKNDDYASGPVWVSFGSGGGNNTVGAGSESESFLTYGTIDWYGATYTPINGELAITAGDSYNIRITFNTDNDSLSNRWGIDHLTVDAGCVGCVPEPGSALLGLFAFGLLSLRRRR